MKLLILGKYYAPARGGIETHTRDLALAAGRRHTVRVLVHNTGPKTVIEHIDGVELIRAGTLFKPLKQPISPDVFRYIRDFNPDVIHIHAPNLWATFAALVLGGRARIIVTHHADIVGREPVRSLALIAYRALVKKSAALVVSASNNHLFSRDLKGVDHPSIAIPFCLEPSPITAAAGFETTAQKLRGEHFGDRPLVSFVGRLVPYKGLEKLIAALALIPDVCAVIIGEGPLMGVLRAQAASLGLTDRIHFAGACDETTKLQWLAASDMFVLPSTTTAEAFGIVQIEAMLLGKAVITTDLKSGVPQVGLADVTALIVPPGDVDALAEAIRRLATDTELRTRMGEAGRTRAQMRFSPERFERSILALYDAVARGVKPGDPALESAPAPL